LRFFYANLNLSNISSGFGHYDPAHAYQEVWLFHGHYCYLPLFIFCGDFLLSAHLPLAEASPTKTSATDLSRPFTLLVIDLLEIWG